MLIPWYLLSAMCRAELRVALGRGRGVNSLVPPTCHVQGRTHHTGSWKPSGKEIEMLAPAKSVWGTLNKDQMGPGRGRRADGVCLVNK